MQLAEESLCMKDNTHLLHQPARYLPLRPSRTKFPRQATKDYPFTQKRVA